MQQPRFKLTYFAHSIITARSHTHSMNRSQIKFLTEMGRYMQNSFNFIYNNIQP